MAEKKLKTRIQMKHDTAEHWEQATNFIPLMGEIIIYEPDSNYNYFRVKVGDGTHTVAALPFIDKVIYDYTDEAVAGATAGMVKSVNGLFPDENGNVEDINVTHIQFIDGSAMVPGMIQCPGNDAISVYNVFSRAPKQPYRFERVIMGTSPLRAVFCISYESERLADGGNLTHLHFGKEYADILVNTSANTITLDPNWVAPEATATESYVDEKISAIPQSDWNENDVNSKAYVKNRTHYSEFITTELLPLTNAIVTKHPSLSCYWQGAIAREISLLENHFYTVNFNNTEYSCSPTKDSSGFLYLGNPSLWNGDSNTGNNEPFALRAVGTTLNLIVPQDGSYTISIQGPSEKCYKIHGKYTGFYSNTIGGINTKESAVNSGGAGSFGLGGYAMGANSFAHGASSTAQGENSVALNGSTALAKNQFTQGTSNIVDTNNKYAHIVGNGTSSRSNAYTLDWLGNGWFAGDVYVGSTSGTNKDEGSKKLATEFYVNALVGETSVATQISTAISGIPAITNDEIDAICGNTLSVNTSENEFVDVATGLTYRIYVENGKLHMTEVE